MKKKETGELIEKLLNKPTKLSQKFHYQTKIKKLNTVKRDEIPESWIKHSYKAYPRLEKIILEIPQNSKNSFLQVLKRRNSSRDFGKDPLSIEKISQLLYYTFGLRSESKARRFYPSAGGRYPIEAYFISLNSDVPKGLYHYNVKLNSLEILQTFSEFRSDEFFNLNWIQTAGCIIVLTAVFERTTVKYGERGYRHVLSETGAITQLLYNLSAFLNLEVCAVGGYKDDELNKFLDVDGVKESTVGVVVFGEPS